MIQSPTEIVCYTCVFINYWAGLQKEVDKCVQEDGAKVLQKNSVVVHPRGDQDDGRNVQRQLVTTTAGARTGSG